MAWNREATSHYLSQGWPISKSPNGVTRPQWVNTTCLFTENQAYPPFHWNANLFAYQRMDCNVSAFIEYLPVCLNINIILWRKNAPWICYTNIYLVLISNLRKRAVDSESMAGLIYTRLARLCCSQRWPEFQWYSQNITTTIGTIMHSSQLFKNSRKRLVWY